MIKYAITNETIKYAIKSDLIKYTGCFRFIVKMLELITQVKKQPSSSDW